MTQSPKPIALVVEDDVLTRMPAVDAFLETGFDVLEAEHAASALVLHFQAKQIHVLFTDINMPGEMNGIDLAST